MAAAAVQPRNKATAKATGPQWLPPNGRICWPQPVGDIQAGQALLTRRPLGSTWPAMLPIPLVRKAIPRTAAARPLAPRVLDVSWVVTAATPANAMPTAATAAPAVNEP